MQEFPKAIIMGLDELQEHYECFEEIKLGANGYLFFAQNKISQKEVAIKFYYVGTGDRQHDEPRNLAAINSPNVLSILDARLISKDWGYFITPRCKEGDLDDLIRTFPSAHKAIDVAINICHGLSAIHAQGMVHRDLKPGNIVLEDGIPKIADFGSVRAFEEGQDITRASKHSILYRPPESFKSDEYSKRGDIYQIGLVLYQLLGGELSYNGEDYLNRQEVKEYNSLYDNIDRALYIDRIIAARACEGKLINLISLPPWVSLSVKKCINKLVDPDPDKRIGKISEASAYLSQVRTSMKNWKWSGNNVILIDGDKFIEICPCKDGNYEAFQTRRGKGVKQRIRGVRPGNLHQVIRQVK